MVRSGSGPDIFLVHSARPRDLGRARGSEKVDIPWILPWSNLGKMGSMGRQRPVGKGGGERLLIH